jgi:hypothetical protein
MSRAKGIWGPLLGRRQVGGLAAGALELVHAAPVGLPLAV